MRSPFRKPLIPAPKGFDDPVKQSCGHAERKWNAAGAALGSGAASITAATVAGVALPPLAPFMAAGAAVSVLLKLRAQWGREDPPREDYRHPVRLPERRIDVLQLIPSYISPREFGPYGDPYLPDFPALIGQLEESGVRLGATIEALEKALGAAEQIDHDDDALDMAEARFEEARTQALLTSYALRAVSQTTESSARSLKRWFPLSALDEAGDIPAVATLWDAIDREDAGRLLAAGVDPMLLEAPLDLEGSLSARDLPETIVDAGVAALDLAKQLEAWGFGDDGSDPVEFADSPLSPSQSPTEPA